MTAEKELKLPGWMKDVVTLDNKLSTNYCHFADWSKVSIINYGCKFAKTVYTKSFSGVLETDKLTEFVSKVRDLEKEMNLLFTDATQAFLNLEKESSHTWHFWDEDSVVIIDVDEEEHSTVEAYTFSKDKANKVHKTFSSFFCKRNKRKGKVHLLESTSHGINICELGHGGVAFEEQNYDKEIVNDFNYIKKQLKEESPEGRLFIVNGPPGTGKSYFIRGLINDTSGVVFLLIPSKQISSLSDPGLFPAIRRLHREEDVPIVLILEDADGALLPRDTSNMSMISDILNFADGIIGSIVDIRILATTNAEKMEIEPALLRKRRLGRNVYIGKLNKETAQEVFNRLVKDKKVIHEVKFDKDDEFTLAEIYSLVAEATGETPLDLLSPDKSEEKSTSKARTGFGF